MLYKFSDTYDNIPTNMRRQEFKEWYKNVYLESEYWKKFRDYCIKKAEYRCLECKKEGHLDVHHLTYKNLGSESLEDVIVLCRDCHEKRHGIFKCSEKNKIDEAYKSYKIYYDGCCDCCGKENIKRGGKYCHDCKKIKRIDGKTICDCGDKKIEKDIRCKKCDKDIQIIGIESYNKFIKQRILKKNLEQNKKEEKLKIALKIEYEEEKKQRSLNQDLDREIRYSNERYLYCKLESFFVKYFKTKNVNKNMISDWMSCLEMIDRTVPVLIEKNASIYQKENVAYIFKNIQRL